MKGHQLQSIRVQDVALVAHPSSELPVLLYLGEEGEGIGCKVCGMPMDRALEEPCPGYDISEADETNLRNTQKQS